MGFDDWMDNPIEMDDWIWEMDEETKGGGGPGRPTPPPGGGAGCGCGGCLTLVVGSIAVIIMIVLFVSTF